MFSLRAMVAAAVASLTLCHQTSAFVAPLAKFPRAMISSAASSSTTATARRAATRMSAAYAPANVQDVWDNHLAAFGGKDVSFYLLLLLGSPRAFCSLSRSRRTLKNETFRGSRLRHGTRMYVRVLRTLLLLLFCFAPLLLYSARLRTI